jgi:hypothetical protein
MEPRARASKSRPQATHSIVGVLLAATLLPAAGCNVIDIARGRNARIVARVPGGDVATGEMDCWLTIQFDRPPSGVDLRDVKVRFDSLALQGPEEFDWSYIARNDVISQGSAFGSGYRPAAHTQPSGDPPLGEELKVRFPLRAKRRIEDAPTLRLEAELIWGGKSQDSEKRLIEHVYSRNESGVF